MSGDGGMSDALPLASDAVPSTDRVATDVLVEVVRPAAIQPARRAVHSAAAIHPADDATWHWTALFISLGVIIAASVLEIRGTTQVAVPGLAPLPELCLWRRCFGSDCAGCGLTRSFVSLAHGDLPGALRYHVAGTLLFACVVAQVPYRSWQLARLHRGKPAIRSPSLAWLGWALLPIFVIQWIVRMLG